LRDLAGAFDLAVKERDTALFERFAAYRGESRRADAAAGIGAADRGQPRARRLLAQLFPVDGGPAQLHQRAQRDAQVARFKKEFVAKRVAKVASPGETSAAAIDALIQHARRRRIRARSGARPSLHGEQTPRPRARISARPESGHAVGRGRAHRSRSFAIRCARRRHSTKRSCTTNRSTHPRRSRERARHCTGSSTCSSTGRRRNGRKGASTADIVPPSEAARLRSPASTRRRSTSCASSATSGTTAAATASSSPIRAPRRARSPTRRLTASTVTSGRKTPARTASRKRAARSNRIRSGWRSKAVRSMKRSGEMTYSAPRGNRSPGWPS